MRISNNVNISPIQNNKRLQRPAFGATPDQILEALAKPGAKAKLGDEDWKVLKDVAELFKSAEKNIRKKVVYSLSNKILPFFDNWIELKDGLSLGGFHIVAKKQIPFGDETVSLGSLLISYMKTLGVPTPTQIELIPKTVQNAPESGWLRSLFRKSAPAD